MIQLLLFVLIVYEIIKIIASVVSNFRSLSQKREYSEHSSINWYGICDNCGIKSGLHKLTGKRYCATCHATIKTKGLPKKQSGEWNDY